MHIVKTEYRLKMIKALVISSSFTVFNAHSANLLSFYEEAIIADPQLLTADAQVEVGEARERQALAGLLPQASATGTISRNRYERGTVDNYTGRRYNLSIRQPLFNGDSWYGYKSAQHDTNKQRALFEDTKSALAFDLTNRYLDVLVNENALTLVNSELEAIEGQLKLLHSKQKRQLALKTDVLNVEARLNTRKVDAIEAKNNVAISRESLTLLVNRPLATENIADFLDEIPYTARERSLDEWVLYAYDHSKLYQSMKQDVKALQKRIRQRKSGYLPIVELQLNAQRSNIGSENVQTNVTTSYTAGVSLSIPLYSGGRTGAEVRESYANLKVARQKVEQLRREIKKGVRESLLNTSASWSRIKAGRVAIIASTKSHDAMRKGLTYGTVTVVDVLDALSQKTASELDFKRAQYDFIRNYVQLQYLSGSLDKQLMAKIKSWQRGEE